MGSVAATGYARLAVSLRPRARRISPTCGRLIGERTMTLILVWLLNAVALLIVAYLLPGITVASFGSALVAALVLGLLNMLVKPVLVLLTLPITIVTLGLFLLVLNALLFWLAGSILRGFQVNGFWWAVGGAILYSIISGLLSRLIP
jgi:putative membrane protein